MPLVDVTLNNVTDPSSDTPSFLNSKHRIALLEHPLVFDKYNTVFTLASLEGTH
jgi:hypothetical protein